MQPHPLIPELARHRELELQRTVARRRLRAEAVRAARESARTASAIRLHHDDASETVPRPRGLAKRIGGFVAGRWSVRRLRPSP